MAITAASLAITPYMVGNFSGFTAPKLRAEHTKFAGTERVNLAEAPTGKVTIITPQKDPNGDTIYLSYFQNEISSVRISSPPPAGVDKFLTDSLSGCMVFVDSIAGTNDLILYHSNAKMHSPPGNFSGTHPSMETGNATTHLTDLHTRAQADYQPTPPLLPLVINNVGSINKPTYNQNAQIEVDRKTNMGRNKVEFLGGTIVIGFWTGVVWTFYWQTFGDTEYDRPYYAAKRYTSGKHQDANDTRVLGYGQFY